MVITTKDENIGIDYLKMALSILVIGIHTSPFVFNIWLDRGFGLITSLAVPTFFVVSGFYLQKRALLSKKTCIDSSKRILRLIVVWSIIYAPFWIKFDSVSTEGLIKKSITGHLWYLYATVFAYMLIYVLCFLVNISKKAIDIIAITLFSLGVILSTYSPLLSILNEPLVTRDGLFYGFPLIWLGYRVAELKIMIKVKKAISIFVFALIGLTVETFVGVFVIDTNSTIMWIFQPLCAVMIMLIVLNININKHNNFAIMLRKISTIIYITHYMWIYVCMMLGLNKGLGMFLVVTILSIVFSIILNLIGRRHHIVKFLL